MALVRVPVKGDHPETKNMQEINVQIFCCLAVMLCCDSCRLDGKFVELLQTVLCSSKSPEQIQVLCAAILREMSPCNDLILSCDEIQDTKLLSLVSSVLLAQVNDLSSQKSSLVDVDLLSDCSLFAELKESENQLKVSRKKKTKQKHFHVRLRDLIILLCIGKNGNFFAFSI